MFVVLRGKGDHEDQYINAGLIYRVYTDLQYGKWRYLHIVTEFSNLEFSGDNFQIDDFISQLKPCSISACE